MPLTAVRWSALLVLAGIMLSGCQANRSSEPKGWTPGPSVPLLELRGQKTGERLYRSLRLTEELRIGGEEKNLAVYNPIDLIADDEGHIYVLDEGSHQVKKFDADGQPLQRYGAGRGEGPGEFIRPVDFAVRDNGEVLVLDYGSRQITLFLADGSLLGQHGVEGSPVQLVAGADEHLVHLITRDHLFHIFKTDGSELRSFGHFMEAQERQGLAVQGTLASGDDTLYYIGFWSGHLVALTSEGEVRYARKSIDRLQIPGFTHSDRIGAAALDNEGYPVHPMLARVEDALYATVLFPDEGHLVIDAYDAADGTYQFSAEWDESCGPAAMTTQHIYALCDGAVVRFSYGFE